MFVQAHREVGLSSNRNFENRISQHGIGTYPGHPGQRQTLQRSQLRTFAKGAVHMSTQERLPSGTSTGPMRSNSLVARDAVLLTVIVVAASLLRVYWLLTRTAVIENEGVVYALIARHLITGVGYVGIYQGSPDLMFPFFYPLAIAFASMAFSNLELAGRAVSLVAGALLVMILYAIARHVYGRQTAVLCASLAAFHPLLIGFSAAVYSESAYLTLMMAGVYFGLRTLDGGTSWFPLLTGLCFGLAYLTRPEALSLAFLSALFVLIVGFARKSGLRAALASSMRVLAVSCFVAAPYIVYLTLHVGQIRVEGKTPINYAIGARITSGMSYARAAYEIDHNLEEKGPYLKPHLAAIRSAPPVSPSHLLAAARRNLVSLAARLLESSFLGAPLLPLLVVLGLFSIPWDRRRLLAESYLTSVFVVTFAILLTAHAFFDRFLLPFLPFLLLWSARGLEGLSRWLQATASLARVANQRLSRYAAHALTVVVIALVVGISLVSLPKVGELEQGTPRYVTTKQAGLWLGKYMPGPKTIMDTAVAVSYYADGYWAPYPYADSQLAMKYVQAKRPTFLVVRSAAVTARPYLSEWLEQGIPDQHAELIYSIDDPAAGRIRIYRWLAPNS